MVNTDSLQSKDELLADNDADELPSAWDGGEAWHSGGGIWVREFTNEDRELRVTYSLSDNQPGVGLDAISWDDSLEMYLPDETLATNQSPETDANKFSAALEFMTDVNAGEYE